MGAPNQVIVFSFFGEIYLRQFQVCAKTIPEGWNVVVVTDQDYRDSRFTVLQVDSPVSLYECFTFRKRIPDFVDITKFDRVWHCDCDVMFTGDLLGKYYNPKYADFIIVSDEPMTTIDNEHMGRAIKPVLLQKLVTDRAPAINSGLIGVNKDQNSFWNNYRILVEELYASRPDVLFPDQQILNKLYHESEFKFKLTDKDDIGFPTRGTKGWLMNHYIGAYIENKDKVMEADL